MLGIDYLEQFRRPILATPGEGFKWREPVVLQPLDPTNEAHIKTMTDFLLDTEMTKYFLNGIEGKTVLNILKSCPQQLGRINWISCNTEGSTCYGYHSLHSFEAEQDEEGVWHLERAYRAQAVLPMHQNNGLAFLVGAALLKYSFTNIGINQVCLRCDKDNEASKVGISKLKEPVFNTTFQLWQSCIRPDVLKRIPQVQIDVL